MITREGQLIDAGVNSWCPMREEGEGVRTAQLLH